MKALNPCEYELVAIGAAIASNCVPCIEYHIPEARKAGLTDAQILEAVQLAEKLKQVPARKVLDAAKKLLEPLQPVSTEQGQGCGAAAEEIVGRCCA